MASSLELKYFVNRNQCPSCLSKNTESVFIKKFTQDPIKKYLEEFYNSQGFIELEYLEEADYELMECQDCTLVYQRYIPNDFLMTKLYNEWISPEVIQSEIEKKHSLKFYFFLSKQIYKICKTMNKNPSDLRVLDFGMGWGSWCKMASAFGIEAFGVEISEDRIQYAKKFGIENLYIEALEKNSFDFINTEQVFEHIPNPNEILKILSNSLKPGGLLKISVPDGNLVKEKLSIMNWDAPKNHPDSLNIVAPLEHINCYTTKSIVDLAEMNGLKWYFLPKYPMIAEVDGLPSLKNNIKTAFQIPKQLIEPIWQKSRSLLGKTYIEKPRGTNLYFRKEF
jgi:SAM-dependent methyltransferase